MVFATIGFALKSGLALGSASFLWIMAGFFHYDTKAARRTRCRARLPGVQRHRGRHPLCHLHRPVDLYQLNKRMTIQMADELAERRKQFATA